MALAPQQPERGVPADDRLRDCTANGRRVYSRLQTARWITCQVQAADFFFFSLFPRLLLWRTHLKSCEAHNMQMKGQFLCFMFRMSAPRSRHKRWTHWLVNCKGFDVVKWKKLGNIQRGTAMSRPFWWWGGGSSRPFGWLRAQFSARPQDKAACVLLRGTKPWNQRGQENVSFTRLIGTWQRLFGVVKQHQTWNISFLSTCKRHLKADRDSGNKRLTLKNPISSLNCRMTFYLKSFYSSSCLLTCVKVWRSHDAPFIVKRINTRAYFFLT